jgi:hypothetical protein
LSADASLLAIRRKRHGGDAGPFSVNDQAQDGAKPFLSLSARAAASVVLTSRAAEAQSVLRRSRRDHAGLVAVFRARAPDAADRAAVIRRFAVDDSTFTRGEQP